MSAAQAHVPDFEIEFHTVLTAPSPRVFAALTQAEHLARWLCDEAQSDPRGGGKVSLRWRGPEASDQPFAGEWAAFETPRCCALVGGQPEHPDGYAGRVDWTLQSADGGTLLVTRHRMPPRIEYAPFAKIYSGAWPRALERLARYLTPAR